jgi:hypothetical protein
MMHRESAQVLESNDIVSKHGNAVQTSERASTLVT